MTYLRKVSTEVMSQQQQQLYHGLVWQLMVAYCSDLGLGLAR